MKTVWRADFDAGIARPVKCETPGHPHKDVEGNVMYDNTHFPTARLAWLCVRNDAAARFSSDARQAITKRRELAQAERTVADSAAHREAVDTAFHAFDRDNAKVRPPCGCHGHGNNCFVCEACTAAARGNWNPSDYPEVFGG